MSGRNVVAIAALLALGFPRALTAQNTGSIAGSVLLDKGIGLAKAVVVYNKAIKLARDSKGSIQELEPHVSGSVVTASDGSFLVKSLPAGSYHLCALPVETNQIKSCYSLMAPVTVQAASALAGVVLNVTTGVLLSIVIDDPKGQISSKTLAVGWMSASGAYSPATLAVASPPSATYTVAIPRATQGNLFLDGSLTIVDATANAVPMRARSVPVSVAAEAGITVTLTVQ